MTLSKLDLTGLKCPLPALKTRKALKALSPGDRLEVHCTDPLSVIDIPALIQETGDTFCSRLASSAQYLDRRTFMDGLAQTNSARASSRRSISPRRWTRSRIRTITTPPPGVAVRNTENEEHALAVHDARGLDLSLDREGFALVRHKTAASDLYDEKIITEIYYPECERLMREATGAKKVVAFDHIVRNAAKAAIKGSGVKMPAGRVHNDYTARSAPQRVRDLMGDEAAELLRRRFAVINVWRPIAGRCSPAAGAVRFADARLRQLLPSDLRYPDRTGEIYAVRYNPNHRWYYFPRMQPDEAILISCYNSGRQRAARFSAHGAFDDPSTPADAPPRESIEVRTLVFF